MLIHFCCCCFLVNYIFVEYAACNSKNLTNEECEATVCLIWPSQSPVLYLIESPWEHLKRQLAGKKMKDADEIFI